MLVETFAESGELASYMNAHPDHFAERYIDAGVQSLHPAGGRVLRL
jgi:hypothetical protein